MFKLVVNYLGMKVCWKVDIVEECSVLVSFR